MLILPWHKQGQQLELLELKFEFTTNFDKTLILDEEKKTKYYFTKANEI